MKKLMIACALLASTSFASFAQSAAAVSSAEARAKSYQKEFSLNQHQYDVIYKAELSYYRQLEVAKEHGGPGSGQAMQMEMGRNQQYKAVLTAEQYSKYDAGQPKAAKPMH